MGVPFLCLTKDTSTAASARRKASAGVEALPASSRKAVGPCNWFSSTIPSLQSTAGCVTLLVRSPRRYALSGQAEGTNVGALRKFSTSRPSLIQRYLVSLIAPRFNSFGACVRLVRGRLNAYCWGGRSTAIRTTAQPFGSFFTRLIRSTPRSALVCLRRVPRVAGTPV